MNWAVKILDASTDGSFRIGGYGVVFGGLDLTGDAFDADTDLFLGGKLSKNPPLLYQHGQDPAVGKSVVGRVTTALTDQKGLYVEASIDGQHPYAKAIRQLVDKGTLGFSSGAVAHLVERVRTSAGNLLKSWPIAELSLTPTPAEPRTVGVRELKALAIELPLGVPLARKAADVSFEELMSDLERAAVSKLGDVRIVSTFPDRLIVTVTDGSFRQIPYTIEADGKPVLGTPVVVERSETFAPPPQKGNRTMKTLNPALKAALPRSSDWDVDADHVTVYGVKLWPLRAFDEPHDWAEREAARKALLTLQPVYVQAWKSYVAGFGKWRSERLAWVQLGGDEQKALAEGIDSAGGFLVPSELAASTFVTVRERSTARRGATTIPCMRDTLEIGVFDFSAEWAAEVPPAGETTISPVQAALVNIYRVRAKAKCSHDLLADQASFVDWLRMAGGAEIALAEDKAFVAGTGIGQPLGFMSHLPAGSLVDVEGTTGDSISNTTATPGSAPKIINVDANLPDAFRANARWFLRGATLAKVRQLVDAQGRYQFPPAMHPQTGEDTLLSHPVSTSTSVDAEGTNGNVVMGLIDLSRYIVAARNMLSLRLDTETFGDTDQVLVSVADRVGGVLSTPDAIRAGQV